MKRGEPIENPHRAMKGMKHMRASLVAVAALSVLALAGCDKSATPGVPLPGAPGAAAEGKKTDEPAKPGSSAADPKALISNAAKSSREAASAKFEWKMNTGGLGDWTSSGEMDFKNNRSKIDSVIDVGGKKMTMSIISDGTTLYMRSTADGQQPTPWEKTDLKELEGQLGQMGGGANSAEAPGRDPMSFIDSIKDFATVTPDGSEAIRGVATTRYKVVIDPAKIPGAEAGAPADGKAQDSKMWVDGKNRLARFQMGVAGDIAMTADFFDYDTPVKIDIPAVG
jgi:hypothetical protein